MPRSQPGLIATCRTRSTGELHSISTLPLPLPLWKGTCSGSRPTWPAARLHRRQTAHPMPSSSCTPLQRRGCCHALADPTLGPRNHLRAPNSLVDPPCVVLSLPMHHACNISCWVAAHPVSDPTTLGLGVGAFPAWNSLCHFHQTTSAARHRNLFCTLSCSSNLIVPLPPPPSPKIILLKMPRLPTTLSD